MATTNKTMTITLKMVDQLSRVNAQALGSLKKTVDFAARATIGLAKLPVGVLKAATSINAYIGAQIVSAPVRSLLATVDRLDEINEKARQFGIGVETYSVYEYAAKRANVAAEELAAGIKMGEKNLGDFALTGKGPAAEALARLSLRAKDLAGNVRPIEELLPEIGRAIAGLGQAEKQSVLADIFGRGFEPIERLLASGDLGKLRKELEDLGGVVTQRQVLAAGRIDDALDRVRASWAGVKAEAVAALADTIEPLLNRSAALIAKIAPAGKGLGFAFGRVLTGGPGAGTAQELVGNVADRAIDLLVTGAKDVGYAIGVSAIEAIMVGWKSSAPVIGDVFRDALGPILNKIPLVNIARSASGELEYLKQRRDSDLPKFLRENTILVNQRKPNGEGMMPLLDETTLRGEIEKAREELFNISDKISAQQELVNKEMAERNLKMSTALKTGFQTSLAAWQDAGKELRAKMTELDVAIFGTGGGASFGTQNQKPGSLAAFAARYAPSEADAAVGSENGRRFASATATGLGTIVPMLAAIAMQVKEKMLAIAGAEVLPDLQARTLDARGFTGQAAAMRLQMAQERERMDLTQKYGQVIGGELLPKLREVQELEARRASFDSRHTEILAKLADAERAYKDGVTLRAAQVQAATLTQARANELNEDARDRIEGSTRATLENLKKLQAAFPEFATIATGAVYDVENSIEQLRLQVDGLAAGNWKQGVLDGLEEIHRKARDLYGFARGFVGSLTDQISGGLATAIVDVASRARSAKEAFKDFLASTLRMVSQLIIQFLILRAISGIAGAFAGGSPVATTGPGAGAQIPDLAGPSVPTLAARGGVIGRIGFRGAMPRMAMAASIVGLMGGGVAGYVNNGANRNADTVLAALANGESVNTRAATRRNLRAIEHMNAGGSISAGAGGGGGITIVQHFNGPVTAPSAAAAREYKKLATEAVAEAMQRDPAYRARINSQRA